MVNMLKVSCMLTLRITAVVTSTSSAATLYKGWNLFANAVDKTETVAQFTGLSAASNTARCRR